YCCHRPFRSPSIFVFFTDPATPQTPPFSLHDALPISQAVTCALHLYTLQAPHIAESSATRMEEMEAVMHSLDSQVPTALQALQALVDEPGRAFLDAAPVSPQEVQTIQPKNFQPSPPHN